MCIATYEFESNKQKYLSTIIDHGFRALSNDPMFQGPYNYPQQNYKTNPAAPYPTNVNNVPYQKRELVEAVLMGNLSKPEIDGFNETSTEDPEDIDCDSCDIVVDDVKTATYINPAYIHISEQAQQQVSILTGKSTTVDVRSSATDAPPSQARRGVKVQAPSQTMSPYY